MKGVELGTAKRMSEVIEEVAEVARRAGRGAHRAQPRQGDRRPAAGRRRRRLRRRGRRPALPGRLPHPVLPPVHQHRRRRLRTRRRGQERHRARRRHRRRHGPRRQRQGRPSSPAVSPRPPGSAWRWAPTRTPSPASPAWATWWPPAPRRCPATTPSAPTSAAGMTLQETIAVTRQTAEGVKSCESVLDLARRHGVDMPHHRDGRRHRPRRQAADGRAQGADVAQRQGRAALKQCGTAVAAASPRACVRREMRATTQLRRP